MMRYPAKTSPDGFTLVELLVYVSLVTVSVLVFTTFLIDITRTATRSRIIREVQDNARYAQASIENAVRASNGIDPNSALSTLENDHGQLTLVTATGTPLTIRWQNNRLEIDEGSGPVALTSDAVRVTQLRFSQTEIAIGVVLAVEQANPSAPIKDRARLQLASTMIPRLSLY